MIQPYVSSIDESGANGALVFIDGDFISRMDKGAMLKAPTLTIADALFRRRADVVGDADEPDAVAFAEAVLDEGAFRGILYGAGRPC